jgi:hypothetical protein
LARANEIEDLIFQVADTGEGGTFIFEGERFKVKINDSFETDAGVVAIKLKIVAEPWIAHKTERSLNTLNHRYDGPESSSNPDIRFNDKNPDSFKVTDTFGIIIYKNSADFFDL